MQITGSPALLQEAEALAARLLDSQREERMRHAPQFGASPNAAAGSGREFWQFRRYQSGDNARQIDWRKSARLDTIQIREQEHDSPALLALLLDTHPGMTYRGRKAGHSKGDYATVIAGALASLALRQHQRVRWQASAPMAVSSLAALWQNAGMTASPDALKASPPVASTLVWCSDGWGETPENNSILLKTLGIRASRRVLLAIIDADEEEFPFSGTTLFSGFTGGECFFGKPSRIAGEYRTHWQQHQEQWHQQAHRYGWQVIPLRTDHDAAKTLQPFFTVDG